ncbi:DUF3794 domain-containing protein [Clostridium manihotivorum]|uniref:SipL SPOCS domain-containing protein n=1 Tax=Clostridium manihotivorum TaxID=2320868 RepID=A0A3R5UHQ5_9CLOT|nr:DUF3794 domain-containing protein [Clostridium manihotivorum]QAA33996.1 hypothetical protein C1I91_21535 [Clostridium manihotivorum]
MIGRNFYGCRHEYPVPGCPGQAIVPVRQTAQQRPGYSGRRQNCSKMLQVPVILAYGETQELVRDDSIISPPSPPAFRVINVDTEVVITNLDLIPRIIHNTGKCDGLWWAKVIVEGYIDRNVNYKTIEDTTADSVNGPVYHFTNRIPFSTFVELKAYEPLCETDNVEILEAYVEGERAALTDPNPVAVGAPDWAVTYNRISGSEIVRINLKVTRMEHVPVTAATR